MIKLAIGLLGLCIFQGLGELVVRLLAIDLPGALLGMILLLITLVVRPALRDWLEGTSGHLITNVSLLFMPASVGVFFLNRDILLQFPAIVVVLIGSTGLAMAFMAWVVLRSGVKRD